MKRLTLRLALAGMLAFAAVAIYAVGPRTCFTALKNSQVTEAGGEICTFVEYCYEADGTPTETEITLPCYFWIF